MNIPGESQIGAQTIQQIASDVVSQQGISKLHQKMVGTALTKPVLDQQLEKIAKQTGTDFQSRIKNATTVVQKIAQKRIQGRKYGIDDINDTYGGRFIVDNKKNIPEVLDLVRKMALSNNLKVLNDERVKTGTYNAHHIDFQTPNGIKGEVQVMTPQQALESVANHSLRSMHGENPEDNVKLLRNKQAQIAAQTPNELAKQKADIIQKIAKQNNDLPLDPRVTASVLK